MGIKMKTEKGDISILGKKISAVTDRPLGTAHPKHPDVIYPVNYGYIEGLFAGDGEEQDVYYLSETQKPLASFDGVVVAVIERTDDDEDKWVAVGESDVGGSLCYECNIREAVRFQEQFHQAEYHILYEKTCGAVMFCVTGGVRRYLLIENNSGHIGFPKGHVEYDETEQETALREVREETSLDARLLGFRSEYTYKTFDNTFKTAVYFLSSYDGEPHFQQSEIKNSWLLPLDEALEKLNFPEDRKVLSEADAFLGA